MALSPLNKILISPDTVRYDTDRYTFLKKCYFRKREEDKIQNEINKASTTEFMRKIDFKLKGIYLTPDKRHNPIVNPLLQIDNLGNEANIQLLSYSQEKKNNNNQNGARYKNKEEKRLRRKTVDRGGKYNNIQARYIIYSKKDIEFHIVEPMNISFDKPLIYDKNRTNRKEPKGNVKVTYKSSCDNFKVRKKKKNKEKTVIYY